jgi:hypothetical protein
MSNTGNNYAGTMVRNDPAAVVDPAGEARYGDDRVTGWRIRRPGFHRRLVQERLIESGVATNENSYRT